MKTVGLGGRLGFIFIIRLFFGLGGLGLFLCFFLVRLVVRDVTVAVRRQGRGDYQISWIDRWREHVLEDKIIVSGWNKRTFFWLKFAPEVFVDWLAGLRVEERHGELSTIHGERKQGGTNIAIVGFWQNTENVTIKRTVVLVQWWFAPATWMEAPLRPVKARFNDYQGNDRRQGSPFGNRGVQSRYP